MPSELAGAAKAALRREILRRREALDRELRRRLGMEIVQRIVDLDGYRSAGSVLAYASFGTELETRPFILDVLERGKTLVLPRVDRRKGRLGLYEVRDLARDLEPGVWGIPEPSTSRCRPARLSEIEFALVPGVAFDVRGGRLGHGAGFYDKLLGSSAARPRLVAGAFEAQVVRELVLESHDVLMDMVVTEHNRYPSGK